jgi:hypothetical protein
MSDEIGAQCGLGEGTHYGCECVMRRIADLERALSASEARAHAAEEHSRGLESALQIMGEENAKIERERDEALSLGERQDKALMRCQSERDEARRALREVLDEIGEINGWRPTALQPGGVLYDRARALSGAGAEEGR